MHDVSKLRSVQFKEQSLQEKRAPGDWCDPCYDLFVENSGSTYHSLCTARDKLKLCKNVVEQAYDIKTIHEGCIVGDAENELEADYFCTHANGWQLITLYHKCPYNATI